MSEIQPVETSIPRPLILASQSPRRRQLLAEAGYRFEVVPSDVEESLLSTEGVEPVAYVQELALAKAKAVAVRFPNHLVLGADTIVDCDGRIIGKPADAREAEQIVRRLFSRPHKVITGIALVCAAGRIEIVSSDTTVVIPRPMTEQQIADHIRSGTWQGKAGAYAIQETGDQFVERLQGSLSNVVGLPMELLCRLLQGMGYGTRL